MANKMSDKEIDKRVARITKQVDQYNSTHDKKLVFVDEKRNPESDQAVVARKYKLGRRTFYFCGCRTLPEQAVVPGKKGYAEFLDEFLETL